LKRSAYHLSTRIPWGIWGNSMGKPWNSLDLFWIFLVTKWSKCPAKLLNCAENQCTVVKYRILYQPNLKQDWYFGQVLGWSVAQSLNLPSIVRAPGDFHQRFSGVAVGAMKPGAAMNGTVDLKDSVCAHGFLHCFAMFCLLSS
jgi:hypothetical protein